MKKAQKITLKILLAVTVLFVCILASPALSGQRQPAEVGSSGTNIAPTLPPSVIQTPEPTPGPTAVPTPEPTPEPFKEYDISLMALGDQLLHMGIVSTGKQPDGSYNFDFLFQDIADYIAKADIRAVNQEIILAGNEKGFSGYPSFNSPTEVADAIAAAGFNVVSHATNHSADRGVEGLISCAEYWQKYSEEVRVLGIHEEETFGEIPLLTIKDVTFALLNYTYSANSSVVNRSLIGHLDFLNDYDKETLTLDLTKLNPQVLEDIKTARELADVVIVFPHWGNEYNLSPTSHQKRFAAQMAEAGADLIIGTHPHVPQPVEWLTTEDGRKTLCFYSLGNYVSMQNRAETMLEGMAWVTFHVTENGVSIVENPTGMLPMVCHYGRDYRMKHVYLLEDYTEELAASHGISNYDVQLTLADLQSECDQVFGDMRLYREDILPASDEKDNQ